MTLRKHQLRALRRERQRRRRERMADHKFERLMRRRARGPITSPLLHGIFEKPVEFRDWMIVAGRVMSVEEARERYPEKPGSVWRS